MSTAAISLSTGLITRVHHDWAYKDLRGTAGAMFSVCENYRYSLWRDWMPLTAKGGTTPTMVFIGLNPSTADEHEEDPTIRRVIALAQREGCGRLVMLNLFAYRSTNPKVLRKVADPIGPHNDIMIDSHVRDYNAKVVCGWGANGFINSRAFKMVRALKPSVDFYCLGYTKDHAPRHPLYLRSNEPLIPYTR